MTSQASKFERQEATAKRGVKHLYGAVTQPRVEKGWWVYLANGDPFAFYPTKKLAVEECKAYNIVVK